MKKPFYRIILAGLFASVIYITTAFIAIPLGLGYANLGDCFVLFAGMLLGPVYGFGAAAVGSALADITLGWVYYSPVTFFVKGTMALIFGLFMKKAKRTLLVSILSGMLCEIFMVAAYFVFELCLYGTGAFATVPWNLVQGFVGLIGAILLSTTAKKLRLDGKLHNNPDRI